MLVIRPVGLSIACFAASAALAPICLSASSPPQYNVTVVGGFSQTPSFGLVSMPQGMNDNGRVVGYGAIVPGGTSGLSWRDGNMVDLGIPAGYDRSFANQVNSFGHIVGGALRADGSGSAALRWVGGARSDLGTLGGQHAAALGINDGGRVVGYSTLAGNSAMRAFSWEQGTMSPLVTPGWAHSSIAYDISNSGYVAGLASGGGTSKPILWYNGIHTELPVPEGSQAASAVAVNEYGHAIGTYEISGGLGSQGGLLWRDNQAMPLGFLGSTKYTLPADLNDAGQVVGTAAADGVGHTGFLWQDGVIYDLQMLLAAPFAEYQITSARAINASGQIAAAAMIDGREMTVMLTPIPSPASVSLLVMAGVVALRRRR